MGDVKSGVAEAQGRVYRMVARWDAIRATEERVLDIAVELFTEEPYEDVALEEVARQAGVTKRTVLRRFGSKEALFVASMDRVGAQMIIERDEAPVGDVAGAIHNLIDHYERWGSNRLRLLAQEDRIAVVAENVEAGRRYHRSWLARTFEPILVTAEGSARRRRLTALAVLTDVYTWKLLRRDLGLSRKETEETLIALINNLKGES